MKPLDAQEVGDCLKRPDGVKKSLKKPHDKTSNEIPKDQTSRQNVLNVFQLILRDFLFLTGHIVML